MRSFTALKILISIVALWLPRPAVADDGSGNQATNGKPKAIIVVRPAAWASALSAWKEYRSSQGHEVLELDAELGEQAYRLPLSK